MILLLIVAGFIGICSHLRKYRFHTCFTPLLVILITGFICRLAFVIATPDFYAPDEESHYNYIRYLVENRSFPIQTSTTDAPTNDWEYYQPPAYYLLLSPVYAAAQSLFHERYYVIRTLRLFSVVSWMGIALLTCLILGRLTIFRRSVVTATLAMVSLLPSWIFLSSMINNSNLTIFLCTLLLFFLTGRRFALKDAVIIGIILGLTLLTKLSSGVFCPLVVAMLLIRRDRHPHESRMILGKIVLIFSIAGLLIFPWALRNYRIYGSLTAIDVGNQLAVWPSLLKGYIVTFKYVFRSFWAAAGIYNNIGVQFFWPGIFITAAAIVGHLRAYIIRQKRPALFTRRREAPFLLLLAVPMMLQFILVLSFAVRYGQGQGRFLFPMIIPIALFYALGLVRSGIKKLNKWIVPFFTIYSTAFTIYCLHVFSRLSLVP